MSRKRVNKKIDYSYKNICTKVISLIYLFVVFSIYPIIMDDKYFNITITKTKFFLNTTIVFIVCYIIGYIIDRTLDNYFDTKIEYEFKKHERFFVKPAFWMEIFLLANIFAWYQSDEGSGAFYGDNGRYMGMYTYVIIGVAFMMLSMRRELNNVPVIIFGVVSLYIYILGIIQHLEIDVNHFKSCGDKECILGFLHYRDGLSENQFDIFMSTLGNINIYASFIVITISVFLALFVFSNEKSISIISGSVLVAGGATVMIANSDSGYLGVVAAGFVLFLFVLKYDKLKKFILGLILLSVGNLLVVLMNHYLVKSYDKRGGVADALDRIDVALFILIILVLLYAAIFYIQKKYKDVFSSVNKNKLIFTVVIFAVLAGILIAIIGNAKGMAIFTFDYKWGTYRGFVWTKCVELFGELPLVNQLFGVGNDCLAEHMSKYCREEMVAVTGKLYDNAHNELLQYLITLGVFGILSYIGLFVSSFVYILKHGKDKPYAIMALACMTGYFAQGLINLNQPITTPVYFVIMAVGVGYSTYLREKKEEDGIYS